ncbi:MAG: tetratricopeptide repeat protein [Planctomycetes bacterium]|nr:tetratricopeptide repeat protein [Planctomycetota bacterium]
MNTNRRHFQQSGNSRKTKLLPAISIAWVTIAIFSMLMTSWSFASEVAPQQQAVIFLKEQISALSEELLSDFPQDSGLALTAARFHQSCNSPYKMMEVLEQGLRYDPKNGEFSKMMGETAFKNGEYEKAIIYWKKFLQLSPKNWDIHNDIAGALIFSGKYKEAIETLEERSKTFAKPVRSYWLIGQAYMQLEKHEKAKEYLEKGIKIKPGHPKGHYLLAKTYIRLKEQEKARHHMEIHRRRKDKVAKLRHQWVKTRNNDISQKSTEGEIKRLCNVLSRLCIRGTKLYRSSKNDGESRKLTEKVETIFQQTIAIHPNQSDIYYEFAFSYFTINHNMDKATELAKKAVELEESAQNYFLLGRIYYKNSDTKDALMAIGKAMNLESKNLNYKQKYDEIKKAVK